MFAAVTERRRRLLQQAARLLGSGTDRGARHPNLAVEVRALDGRVLTVGGKFDVVLREWVGDPDPESWPVWTVSDDQYTVIEAVLAPDSPPRIVCVGGKGSGKTETNARLSVLLALLSPGMDRGVVAPTRDRLLPIRERIEGLMRPQWVLAQNSTEILLVNGCRLQFATAKVYSKDVGSPFAGFTWKAGASIEEEQDIADRALGEVYARCRGATRRSYRMFSTCTLKDSTAWRNRKQRYERQQLEGKTSVVRMTKRANPWVEDWYWDDLRDRLTEREYRMEVEAIDAPPERAIYYQFARDRNVRVRPEIGLVDVTRKLTGASVLVGHDPGSLADVSIVLRAFAPRAQPDAPPTWYVEDELTTRPGADPEGHALALTDLVGARFDLRPIDCVLRADPHGNTETKPHVTVYRELEAHGFRVLPAVYRANPKGTTAHLPGQIPREARIRLVNRLFKSRLFMLPDDRGQARAQELLNAWEMSERDETGRAEAERKGGDDLSHWPAALGYGLWQYEHARYIAQTSSTTATRG
jgi:hypothetical protein